MALVAASAAGACSSSSASSSPSEGPSVQVVFPLPSIASGTEAQGDLHGNLPSDVPVWVSGVDWSAPRGLHHGRLDAPSADVPGGGFDPILGLPVQVNVGTVSFPAGYALPLAAHQTLDVSYHYVNATRAPIDGAISFRLHVLPADAHPIAMGMIALENERIDVPPRSTVVVATTCPMPRALRLHSLLSHTHALGRAVAVQLVGPAGDAREIYGTPDWSDAPIATFDPPLEVPAGASLSFSCTFTNTSAVEVKYGPSAADEMCVVAGHYSVGGTTPPEAITMGVKDEADGCVSVKR